jgi:hypothetical protein
MSAVAVAEVDSLCEENTTAAWQPPWSAVVSGVVLSHEDVWGVGVSSYTSLASQPFLPRVEAG